jgi:CBS domain-containing protein
MGTEHVTVAAAGDGVVADVMLTRPKTLPADSTVGDVRALFAKPSVRTALLVEGSAFRAALDRGDLPDDAPDDAPALRYADAGGDTIAPDAPVAEALGRLAALDEPRLVVVDADGVTLRGLVCLSGGGPQFCVA